jgi:hypothetical protein
MTAERNSQSAYERFMRRGAAAVLAIGLCASAGIFFLAPPDVEETPGPYVASVDNSKRYQLELERIGGKSAVVAAQFNEWFGSLWHGRRLAGTVAAVAAIVSLVMFLAAKLPPLDD